MKSPVFKLATWSTCITAISAQSLVPSVQAQPELVLFNHYIQSLPRLLSTLTNATNYTLLAPSDTAMTRWINNTSPPPTQNEIEATLNYHILHGVYSQGSFSTTPQFASSYLSNSSFTNVTEGAVVELVEYDGVPVLFSALKEKSSITKGDLIASGGLFHIIDTVLSIPQQESATAAAAGMEYYIDIITKGGYLTGQANNLNNALGTQSDMTFFVPNSAAASDNFTSITAGWDANRLDALLVYHAVPGTIVYSSSMQNGTVLPTVQGAEITIYVGENGTMYANNVEILETNYLISNGVMHTIDGILNPYNITAPSLPPAPSTKKKGISIAVIAAIAIAGAVVLFSALAGVFLYRRRSKLVAAAKVQDSVYNKPSNVRRATVTLDSSHQKGSNGSITTRSTDSSHRRASTRISMPRVIDASQRDIAKGSSSSSTTTKTSRRSSHKEIKWSEEAKHEKEKAKVEVEVRRVVGEQLDAFRRSGYYDTSPGHKSVVPVIPVIPVIPAVELDTGFSMAGRYELGGGEVFLPVIEEVYEMSAMQEEEGNSVSDIPSPVMPPAEVEGVTPISRASSWANTARDTGTVKAISRSSSQATAIREESVNTISRTSTSRTVPITEEEEGNSVSNIPSPVMLSADVEEVTPILKASSWATTARDTGEVKGLSRAPSWAIAVGEARRVKAISRASSQATAAKGEGIEMVSRTSTSRTFPVLEGKGTKELFRTSTSRTFPVVEGNGTKELSRTSTSRTFPVVEGNGTKELSRTSTSRTFPVVEGKGTKELSRASSRAMILDRR